MMKKALLAAAAAIAMVAGAAAQTMDGTTSSKESDKTYWWYECSVTKVTPPDKGDKDPTYKANLYLDASDNNFVRVVHTLRSGKEVSRSDQYAVGDDGIFINKNGASTWIGTHVKNRNLAMVGIFGLLNEKLVYNELQFVNGKKVPILEVNSVCHQI
jgi:hypothetical protein